MPAGFLRLGGQLRDRLRVSQIAEERQPQRRTQPAGGWFGPVCLVRAGASTSRADFGTSCLAARGTSSGLPGIVWQLVGPCQPR
jgi:hypothetical protein